MPPVRIRIEAMFRRLRPGKAAAVRSFRQNRRRWWCDRYGLGGRLRRRLFILAPALLAGARRHTKLRQGFFMLGRIGSRRVVPDARRSDQDGSEERRVGPEGGS